MVADVAFYVNLSVLLSQGSGLFCGSPVDEGYLV